MLWFYSPPKGKYGHFHRLLGMIFKLSTLEVLNAIAALENEKHVLELKHNTPSPVHFLLYLYCKLKQITVYEGLSATALSQHHL